jgi:hypothetical protein
VTGPRAYREGTKQALFALAGRTCYYPDCRKGVIEFVEGTPVSNVHIAHICGALPGSPRYDASMTDPERASFENLLLLCKPHHDLVDRIRPDDFSVDLLQEWKRHREGSEMDALRGLGDLTETRLAELLEDAMRQFSPKREVTVEMAAGAIVPETNGVATGPVGHWRTIVDLNPHLSDSLVVLTIARNIGALPASIESFNLYLRMGDDVEAALVGRNDYPHLNPRLPCPLGPGESAKWLTDLDTLRMLIDGLAGASAEVVGFRATVGLGSGETISSEVCPVEDLPERST